MLKDEFSRQGDEHLYAGDGAVIGQHLSDQPTRRVFMGPQWAVGFVGPSV